MRRTLDCDVLVVGSGPGGATTAALLAEAGRDVLMVEEGRHLPLESAESYSLEEMNQKYRNGGLNVGFGRTRLTYLEGRCVGGASEINAALYHVPLPDTLRQWSIRHQLDGMGPDDLAPHFEAIERDMSVSVARDGVGPAAERLAAGAAALGWKVGEVRRFWRYTRDEAGGWVGRRQSITETMVPRFLAAGGRLRADTWVQRIEHDGRRARSAVAFSTREGGRGEGVRIRFREVVLAAGAVQTPALLRRSGVRRMVGDTLRVHPMLRVAARFPEPVNDPSFGVPVHQVEEFKPHVTLGCSHSSLPHLALWLAGDVDERARVLAEWEKLAIFYVAVTGDGRGRVRSLPGFDEPLVFQPITDRDLALLGEGIYRLGELLFAAGAEGFYGPIEGAPPTTDRRGLERLRTGLPQGRMNVSAIHLFCSVPMGGDPRSSAVDPWGRMHDLANVRVHDASILPDTPGVNPQGTIMAVARRNTLRWLDAGG